MTGNITRRKFVTHVASNAMALSGTTMIADMAMAQVQTDTGTGHGTSLSKGENDMMSSTAPISIQSSTLVVNDLTKVGDFYRSVLGLELISQDGETWILGVSDTPLLILQKDVHAQRYPFEAGLFHNAFLMPDRPSLGRWLRHTADQNVQLTGAADHQVSEALYLNDPEGNGIEVYADRPVDAWVTDDKGHLLMNTARLDLNDLAAAGQGKWNEAPAGTVIGHVHLQVGGIDLLHEFMTKELRQDLTMYQASAGFYSSGGYHHHFAGNIWNSPDASIRSPNSTGLAEILLRTDGTLVQPKEVTDPWGNKFVIVSL